jgi:ribosome-binding factor A
VVSPKTIARLQAQIQRRVAHCLQFELADPRAGFLTVTKVELTSDMAEARIFYSVLGDEGEHSQAQHMLEQASGFVKRQVAGILRTRTVPKLRWIFDASIEDAARMDVLIREARARDKALRGESPDTPEEEVDAPGGPSPSDAEDEPQPG